MLRGKYYQNFKGCEKCLLIIGDSKSYKAASLFFRKHDDGLLASNEYISIDDMNPFIGKRFSMTKEESLIFAEICENLAAEKESAHYYFNVSSVADIEILVSFNEYDRLPG